MLIGVPTEIKNNEYRVGLVPASVRDIIAQGHSVVIESGAGIGIGEDDDAYLAVNANIVSSAAEVFERADMIVKVKEPQAVERAMLRSGQVLFTYLHLAADPAQTEDLIDSGAVCVAYETVSSPHGSLPLLAPMSAVAGRMSVQAGAHCLEKAQGGRGILLGGVPGVEPARVVILGGGVVGRHAASMALGLGANVCILDHSTEALNGVWAQFGHQISTLYSTNETVEQQVLAADLVVGCVLIPGAAAPKLVSADQVRRMRPGAVVTDVAIDQGGCFETSRPTTHANPTYVVDGVIHYCVANIPGTVPRTSTYALNNATLPYVLKLANQGYRQALSEDPYFLSGLNVHRGQVTCQEVAAVLDCPYVPAKKALRG